MLAAVPKVRRHGAPVWQRLLRGLWLSGLRPSEAVALDWNDGPFVLDTTGKRPAFRIEAKGQEPRRVGKVFNVIAGKKGKSMVAPEIGRVLSAIGCKAGVVVGQTDKPVMVDGKRAWKPVKLFAGAHDLRRAFCSRWARKVMPAVLQRLARHANIATTMSYYVNLTADEIAADLWADHGATQGNISGNSSPKQAPANVLPR